MAFRPSAVVSKLKPSSRSWLDRQSRDPYVKQRQADPASYRSRSAFKLIELDNKWNGFLPKSNARTVVDLGAAPGGWSQVVARKMGWMESFDHPQEDYPYSFESSTTGRGRSDKHGSWSYGEVEELGAEKAPLEKKYPIGKSIVAVDLLPIAPIPGVQTLQRDFLSPDAGQIIKSMLTSDANPTGKADVILSDMAANFTGHGIRDTQASLDICEAVFEFAKYNLKTMDETGNTKYGMLLLKHFAHPLLTDFRTTHLDPNFHWVYYIKPEASRARSAEGYWLCRGWRGVKS